MLLLFLGFIIVVILVLFIVQLKKNREHEQKDTEWLKQHGIRVAATIMNVQTKQDWKYGEGYDRDPWDGDLKRQRTWCMYYEVSAQWTHPQTQQVYTVQGKLWSDSIDKIPVEGDDLQVIVDPHILGRQRLQQGVYAIFAPSTKSACRVLDGSRRAYDMLSN